MITNLTIGKYGRLGNQLYQYAAAFSLAKKLNTNLLISEESESQTTLGRFNPIIKKHDTYTNDLFKLFKIKYAEKRPLNYIKQKIKYYYNENPTVRYYPEFWNIQNDTCLHGYFQAKEYVDAYQNDLREELCFQDFYFDYAFNFIESKKMDFKRVVSLHIRRGDGLMDNFAFNAELTLNYYKNIIDDNLNDNDLILIFSDDIDWCKMQFKEKNYFFIDNRNFENSHLKDFALMSMCDINIMAVSTYSWWACWLNPLNKEKKIFMPNKWWGYQLINNSEDIYRYDNWIRYEN